MSEGQQAQYVYDKADRLTAEETSGGEYKTYAYNADGSLSYEQTGGDRTSYVYDKGRLVRRGTKISSTTIWAIARISVKRS